MQYKAITIILGAGSSYAYSRYPYPLLKDLLSEMLDHADKLHGKAGRQRLYLAYALGKAYGLDIQELESGEKIQEEVIQRKYEDAKRIHKLKASITDIFSNIEKLSNDNSTTAYWALSNSIGIYMWQMAKLNISQTNLGHRDTAHKKLVDLINKLLLDGCSVTVIDFNYDCVLEFEKSGRGTNVNFNWDCGRERIVIADILDNRTPSEIVAAKCFMKPLDEENYAVSAQLIKPHGDYCTFLLGDQKIFHEGGRHSQTSMAIFPKELRDISHNDNFLRCSILPPTESRFRHSSVFYDEEVRRMKSSLTNCEAVLIIGWSAGGADSFYRNIFEIASKNRPSGPDIYIIDKSSKVEAKNLTNRVNKLFNNTATVKHTNVCGFDEEAVRKLERCLI